MRPSLVSRRDGLLCIDAKEDQVHQGEDAGGVILQRLYSFGSFAIYRCKWFHIFIESQFFPLRREMRRFFFIDTSDTICVSLCGGLRSDAGAVVHFTHFTSAAFILSNSPFDVLTRPAHFGKSK